MKVLLLKDVYKLGHAGDVKKVADGYARNYLIPRSLATLATAGSLARAEKVRDAATKLRDKLNTEMGAVAEKLGALTLHFTAKAGETGKAVWFDHHAEYHRSDQTREWCGSGSPQHRSSTVARSWHV